MRSDKKPSGKGLAGHAWHQAAPINTITSSAGQGAQTLPPTLILTKNMLAIWWLTQNEFSIYDEFRVGQIPGDRFPALSTPETAVRGKTTDAAMLPLMYGAKPGPCCCSQFHAGSAIRLGFFPSSQASTNHASSLSK